MRIQSLNQSFKLASAVLAKITQRFIPLIRGHELNGSLTKYRVPRTSQSKIKDLTPIMKQSKIKDLTPIMKQSKIKDLTPIMKQSAIKRMAKLLRPFDAFVSSGDVIRQSKPALLSQGHRTLGLNLQLRSILFAIPLSFVLCNHALAQVQTVAITPGAAIGPGGFPTTRNNVSGIFGLSTRFSAAGTFRAGYPLVNTAGSFQNAFGGSTVAKTSVNDMVANFTPGDAYIRGVTFDAAPNTLYAQNNGSNVNLEERINMYLQGGTVSGIANFGNNCGATNFVRPVTYTGGIGQTVTGSRQVKGGVGSNRQSCGVEFAGTGNSITQVTGRYINITSIHPIGQFQPFSLRVQIARDFGDAPASYHAAGTNQAAHFVRGDNPLYLGPSLGDFETAPSYSAAASADTGENGITLPNLQQGKTYSLPITFKNTSGNNAFVSMWIDYQGNGTWNNTTEKVLNDRAVANNATSTIVTFTVPATAAIGATYARLRICDAANDCNVVNTSARGGEVEDFRINVIAPLLASSCNENTVSGSEALYTLDSSSSDDSGNNHNPTSIGTGISFSTDAIEGANSATYNGTGGNGSGIVIDDAFFNAAFTTRTMSMFIKPSNLNTTQMIVDEGGSNNGLRLLLFTDGNLYLSVVQAGVFSQVRVPFPTDGQWHQIGYVYDAVAGKAWLYLDGYPVNSLDVTAMAAHGSGLSLFQANSSSAGYASATVDRPYTGLMDDVAVYSSALTPKNMLDIADCAIDNLLTDLVGVTCPVSAYLVQTTSGDWYDVDLVTGEDTLGSDNLNIGVNAIGFNELDGRIWGACRDDTDTFCERNQLIITSVNADGTYTSTAVGPIAGLPVLSYVAGDVYNGVYYLRGGNNFIYAVDADPSSVTYLQLIDTITLSLNPSGMTDIAVNPVDGFAYALSTTDGNLIKIDLSTGTVTNLGLSGAFGNPLSSWGAIYFDDLGYLYTSNNNSGEISRIDLSTDPGTDYDETNTVLFSNGPASGANDGARCPGPLPIDWGDAPEAAQGNAANGTPYGFCTSLENNGPRHGNSTFDVASSTNTLSIGSLMTIESDGTPDLVAGSDGNDDGVAALTPLAGFGPASPYTISVAVTNNTGADATLCGWVDTDQSQTFTNNNSGCVTVADGATSVDLPLNVSSLQTDINETYFMRLRIASDPTQVASPCGVATNGEVEDYFIPAGTLPVTLSSFDSAQTGKRLNIDWGTSSELFNAGFQLWGLDKATQQWRVLNKWLVASGGGNSVEPQSYSKRIRIPKSIKELESLGISSVDSNGKEHYYGPFEVGKRYGELTHLDPIDWHDVRAQADASMTAKGYTRVYGKGYKKVASTDLNKMAADSGSTVSVQFGVSAKGLYKLSAQDMLLSGSDWSKIPKGEIALLNSAGNPVAREIVAKGTGRGQDRTLGDAGYIVFYANSVDQVQGLYSGEAVYRMVRDTTKARIFNVQGKQGLDGGYSTSYTEQSWTEQQNQYLVNSVLPDPWLSAVVLSYPDRMRGAIYSVPVEADVLRDQPMELIIRAGRSSAQKAVDADNDGIQDPEHILQGIVASPSSATGYVLFDAQTAIGSGAWETRFNIAGDIELPDTGVINAGAAMTAGAGYTFSEVYVDAVGVAYSRPYVSKAGDNHLNFSAEQDEPGYRVQVPLIRGAVAVYASDGANLVKIKPESVDKARTASGERVRWISFAALQGAAQLGSTPIEYWVTNNDGYLSVANLHPTNITAQAELLNAVSGSDYLIISHPAFMGESLTQFADHKRSLGHTVSVVDYLEVVNSFAGGQSGPQGLTDYLNAVEAQTGGGLAHVLLVGGSTYDHRNYLSHDAITFIPTHYGESIASRHTPSDSLYVQDASGAQFAAIGRWPGRTMADIDKLIAATTQWDTQAIEEPSVLLIAEQTKVDEGIDFASAMDDIGTQLPADYLQTKVYSTEEIPAANTKAQIKAALNAAPQLVIYNGHGSTSQLSTRNLYNATDAVDNQASSSALWLPMSCYMTYYESTSVNTLAHQLLFSGQSVAISGASLLSSQGGNLSMGKSILSGLNTDNSIGASIDTAKAAANDPGTSVNWSLLGDPSIRIK